MNRREFFKRSAAGAVAAVFAPAAVAEAMKAAPVAEPPMLIVPPAIGPIEYWHAKPGAMLVSQYMPHQWSLSDIASTEGDQYGIIHQWQTGSFSEAFEKSREAAARRVLEDTDEDDEWDDYWEE